MFARHKNRTYLLAGQTIPYLRRVAWVDGCVLLDRCAGVDKNKSGTSNDGCPANLPTTTFVLAFCGIILRCVCTLRFPIWNRLLWILYHLNPLPHYHLYHQIQHNNLQPTMVRQLQTMRNFPVHTNGRVLQRHYVAPTVQFIGMGWFRKESRSKSKNHCVYGYDIDTFLELNYPTYYGAMETSTQYTFTVRTNHLVPISTLMP